MYELANRLLKFVWVVTETVRCVERDGELCRAGFFLIMNSGSNRCSNGKINGELAVFEMNLFPEVFMVYEFMEWQI